MNGILIVLSLSVKEVQKKQGLYVSTVLKSSKSATFGYVLMLKSNIFYKSFFEGAFLKWPLRLIEGHLHRFLNFYSLL